jgi:uncharacterized protein (AIM24 family)
VPQRVNVEPVSVYGSGIPSNSELHTLNGNGVIVLRRARSLKCVDLKRGEKLQMRHDDFVAFSKGIQCGKC